MELFDDGEDDVTEGNRPEYTVGELSGAIKRAIEGEFGHVRLRGEIGRVTVPRSGHVYLDIKDDRAVIAGIIWKGVANKLTTAPEEGMEVIVTGRITTFPGQSKYQIIIEDLKPAGAGALMALLEKRRAALQAEGLFDADRKRALPYLPDIIGVVTSPTGAVIRDILHRLRDRFPRKVLIWPVAVQGASSAPEVARAIAGFNALRQGGALPRPDLIIVARGGGSVEDLWGFNEEAVVRAAAASDIPLISAVGHETDTTLIDHAADKRAPTPTAAAELAVPVRHELMAWLGQQGARMGQALSGGLVRREQRLRDLSRALPRQDSLLDTPRQRLDRAADRLDPALRAGIQQRALHLAQRAGGLRPQALRDRIAADRRALDRLASRLDPALVRVIADKRRAHDAQRLRPEALKRETGRLADRLGQLTRQLSDTAFRQTRDWRARIDAAERLRVTLGYEATLERGFAVVRSGETVITTAQTAKSAGSLEIQFADGRVSIGGATPKKPIKNPPEQGSLF